MPKLSHGKLILYLYIFLRRLSLRWVYFIIYVNYYSSCVSAPAIGTIAFSFCNVVGITKSQNKVKSSFPGCLVFFWEYSKKPLSQITSLPVDLGSKRPLTKNENSFNHKNNAYYISVRFSFGWKKMEVHWVPWKGKEVIERTSRYVTLPW